jgi:hypothetical protein
VGLGRGVAAFFGMGAGLAPPFVHDRFGHARSNQPYRHALTSAQVEPFVDEALRFSAQPRRQFYGVYPPSHRLKESGLMIVPRQKVGLGCRNLGDGLDLKVAQVKEKQRSALRSLDHRVDLFVIWHRPRYQCQVGEALTEIFPHQLNFGAGGTCPAATAGQEALQGRGQRQACAIGNVDGGKRSKQFSVTDGVACVELRKRSLEQGLQKRHRPATHPLMERFGRNGHWPGQLRRFGRQLP